MELRQLRYFIEVAEREHVSEAAMNLHVAQSAISRQIANLEAELGVTLFEREGRNIKLTQIGRIFLENTKTAMKAIDHATKQIEEYLDPERGSIKIGFPTSLASHFLPTVLSEFKSNYPKLTYQLRQGSYNFLIESVKNREIDLAFLGPVPTNEPDIKATILFTEKLHALLPTSHELSDRPHIQLSELRNENFVVFPEGYIFHDLVINGCRQAGFSPTISSQGEDLDAIKGMVSAGIGVTLLPDSSFYDTTPRFTKKVPIDSPQLNRTVGIVIPKHRDLAPSEQVFYKFVKDFFAKLESFQSGF